jgi:UDP:flavonoid glycosyltransferase YjiC (YdhE family)
VGAGDDFASANTLHILLVSWQPTSYQNAWNSVIEMGNRSPELIPKPKDWGSNITVAGFFFLPLASAYNAPPELLSFLDGGPPPIYIGFGSIVVDDPDGLTHVIFEAIRLTGVRAIVSKGWTNLGGSERTLAIPANVFMLGDCPHDWLFHRVSCVVHHGGAGTTAAGIAAGKPTVIVPFFGDQPFWGDMIYRAGAGPRPIPFKMLSAAALADAITAALKLDIQRMARELGDRVRREHGSETGVRSFHDRLPIPVIDCALVRGRVAVWQLRKRPIRLSAMAAVVLKKEGLLDFSDLEPCVACSPAAERLRQARLTEADTDHASTT